MINVGKGDEAVSTGSVGRPGFIGNTQRKAIEAIEDCFRWAERADIAVSYVKDSGVQKIGAYLHRPNRIRLLFTFDMYLTDPRAIRDLLDTGIECREYHTRLSVDEITFHPKVYIFQKGSQARVLLGSSNLSEGGLSSNVEANVLLDGQLKDSPIREIVQFYKEKWESPAAQEVTQESLARYEKGWKRVRAHQARAKKDTKVRSTAEALAREPEPVIICHTIEHDKDNIYDHLMGVPKNAGTLPRGFVRSGTKIFVYYKAPVKGIKTIVEATGEPYVDTRIIDAWSDAAPEEDYRHRIDTRPVARFAIPVSYGDLMALGIRRRDTGAPFCTYHLRGTVIPISKEDGEKIERLLHRRNR